jgi:hypothetical protein
VDLLMIVRKVWRYRLLTLPVVILTLVGAVYVVGFKQPVYEAKASFALLNPPAPPTAEDIARDPSLAKVKSDNPYTRFGDQSVIIELLSSTMSGESARTALVKAGADSRYTVAPSADFGSASPIVQINAVGWSAATAIRTAEIVANAARKELDRMQEAQSVDVKYRIKALPVTTPDQAQLQASGKLRMLVGVLVLGAVLLFLVVSVADALDSLRRERMEHLAMDWEGPLDDPWQAEFDVEAAPTNGRPAADLPNRREHPGYS